MMINFYAKLDEEQISYLRTQNLKHKVLNNSIVTAKELRVQYENQHGNLTDLQYEVLFNKLIKYYYEIDNEKNNSLVNNYQIKYLEKTSCVESIIIAIVAIMVLFFQVLAVREALRHAIAEELVSAFSKEELFMFEKNIQDIVKASKLKDKAIKIGVFVSKIVNVLGVPTIWKAIKKELAWYDLIVASIAIFAQLTLWVSTEFTAFVAELALLGVELERTTEACIKVINNCESECSKC